MHITYSHGGYYASFTRNRTTRIFLSSTRMGAIRRALEALFIIGR